MAMQLDETVPGSVLSIHGEIGNLMDLARTDWRDGGTYDLAVKALLDELDGVGVTVTGDIDKEKDLSTEVWQEYLATRQRVFQFQKFLQRLAARVLRRRVWRDTGQWTRDGVDVPTTTLDLRELRRQLVAAAKYFGPMTLGATVGTSLLNVGNGSLLVSSKRGDGQPTELQFAENIIADCVLDGVAPGGVAGHEVFRFYGAEGRDPMDFDWAGTNYGSGCDTLVRVCDPHTSRGRGNLLLRGFEDFSSNVPSGWGYSTGVPGTHFQMSSAQSYLGSKSLQLLPMAGVNTTLFTYFGSYVEGQSTPSVLDGSTPYAVALRVRKPSGTITAGVLRLALTSSAGTVLNDDAGTANSTTVDLTALGTSWTLASLFVRTPRNLAAGARYELQLTTPLVGASLFLDVPAFWNASELYPGGPWAALLRGSTDFQGNEHSRDSFTLVPTNNRAGASHARKCWQGLYGALFPYAQHRVLQPVSGTTEVDAAQIG